MYTCAQCVNDELGYTDQDGTNSLVSYAQDLLPVAYDYEVNIFGMAPLLQIVLDTTHIFNVEKTAFRPPEDFRVVGYGFALSGSIDDGKHLLQMVEDELQGG